MVLSTAQDPQNSVSGLWYRRSLKGMLREEELEIIMHQIT